MEHFERSGKSKIINVLFFVVYNNFDLNHTMSHLGKLS